MKKGEECIMAEFKELKTDFKIPPMLQHDIDGLRSAVENDELCVDCWQDEIRGSAHGCTGGLSGLTEEQAEIIIDYYCRRRW